mmetsp:Transcript_25612/g.55940  ORF Transcript_25612/g.55940 Transcript_25612/m.55940 type:complete len:298 (-) Transcript_25612:133-1026(-)
MSKFQLLKPSCMIFSKRKLLLSDKLFTGQRGTALPIHGAPFGNTTGGKAPFPCAASRTHCKAPRSATSPRLIPRELALLGLFLEKEAKWAREDLHCSSSSASVKSPPTPTLAPCANAQETCVRSGPALRQLLMNLSSSSRPSGYFSLSAFSSFSRRATMPNATLWKVTLLPPASNCALTSSVFGRIRSSPQVDRREIIEQEFVDADTDAADDRRRPTGASTGDLLPWLPSPMVGKRLEGARLGPSLTESRVSSFGKSQSSLVRLSFEPFRRDGLNEKPVGTASLDAEGAAQLPGAPP